MSIKLNFDNKITRIFHFYSDINVKFLDCLIKKSELVFIVDETNSGGKSLLSQDSGHVFVLLVHFEFDVLRFCIDSEKQKQELHKNNRKNGYRVGKFFVLGNSLCWEISLC